MLDSGPLGLASNPRQSPLAIQCNAWIRALAAGGSRVVVPEITDYAVRRELLRANKHQGLARLDAMAANLSYLSLTTEMMRQAAVFWARARQQGQPTADRHALDADVILAAQAMYFVSSGDSVIVATYNVAHLRRFVPADLWTNIAP